MTRGRQRAVQVALGFVAIILVVLVEATPPLRAAESWLAGHRSAFLWSGASIAVVGFLVMFGGGLYGAWATGRTMSPEEAQAYLQRSSSIGQQGFTPFWKWFRLAFRGKVSGVTWRDEFTPAEAREAAKGAWRTEARWRRNLIVLAGAALTVPGAALAVLGFAPLGVALLVDLLMLALVVRVAWAMRASDPTPSGRTGRRTG